MDELCEPLTFSISSFLLVEAVAALGNKVVENLRVQDPAEGGFCTRAHKHTAKRNCKLNYNL